MPTEIFQFPQGYLSFIGNKASGQNPTILAPTVSGVTDMTPFYLAGKPLTTVLNIDSPVISAPGSTQVIFQVPVREAWVPMFQSCTTESLGAGDTGQAIPILYSPEGGVVYGRRDGNQNSTLNVAAPFNAIDWFRNPVIVPSGWSFGYYVVNNTVAVTGLAVNSALSYYSIAI